MSTRIQRAAVCDCERSAVIAKIVLTDEQGTVIDVIEACPLCVLESFRPGVLARVTEDRLRELADRPGA